MLKKLPGIFLRHYVYNLFGNTSFTESGFHKRALNPCDKVPGSNIKSFESIPGYSHSAREPPILKLEH